MSWLFLDACATAAVGVIFWQLSRVFWNDRPQNLQGLPHPPGPTGLPLLGNVFDMPKEFEWEKVTAWRKQYGDLVYLQNVGRPLLFVNSYQAATDLLDKRSSIYSDRTWSPMVNDVMMWDWALTFIPYSARFHKTRMFLNRFLHPTVVRDYQELQTRETHRLLVGLLETPQNFYHHLRRVAGAIIMMIAYGHEVAAEGDYFVELADEGNASVAVAGNFGSFFVDIFPWLRYVPSWLPGAGWKRQGKEWARISQALLLNPYTMTKERIANGTVPPSMVSQLLESCTNEEGHVADEYIIASTSAIAYAVRFCLNPRILVQANINGALRSGGAETSASSLSTFIHAMALFPEVQKRAQAELDAVVGHGRLPTFADRPLLPYIEAVLLEAMRYHSVVPLCPSHRLMEDDVYNGYFIPAGTSVVANIWGILHDAEEYPDPMNFVPERWLHQDGKRPPRRPNKATFGFGRRLCPGRHLADNSLWIGIASILATFDIADAKDLEANPIAPPGRFRSGFLSQPEPFQCNIKPRSAEAAAVIRQSAVEHLKVI